MLVRVLTLVAVLQVTFLSSTVRSDGIYKAIDPKEFVTIGGIRYYFSVILTDSITNAIRSCNDVGASLVSLETQAEYEAVTNYIVNTSEHVTKRYWTSGAYIENGWAWTGIGRPITYFNWGINDPNVANSTTQACVYLIETTMLDTFCDFNAEIYFICEEDHC